jgi:hypothetical protein
MKTVLAFVNIIASAAAAAAAALLCFAVQAEQGYR